MKKENLRIGERLKVTYYDLCEDADDRAYFVTTYLTELEIVIFIGEKFWRLSNNKRRQFQLYSKYLPIHKICEFRDTWMKRKDEIHNEESIEDLYFSLRYIISNLRRENFVDKLVKLLGKSEILGLDRLLSQLYVDCETGADKELMNLVPYKVVDKRKEISSRLKHIEEREKRWVEEDSKLYYSNEVIHRLLQSAREHMKAEKEEEEEVEANPRDNLSRGREVPFQVRRGYEKEDYGKLVIPDQNCELRNYLVYPILTWKGQVAFEIV